jgi:hypothetical protein
LYSSAAPIVNEPAQMFDQSADVHRSGDARCRLTDPSNTDALDGRARTPLTRASVRFIGQTQRGTLLM